MYESARDMPGQASGGYLRGGVPFSNVNLSKRRSLFPFRNVLGFAQYDWQCISVSCCWNLKRWSIRELQKRWGGGVTRTKERKKAVWMSRGQRRSNGPKDVLGVRLPVCIGPKVKDRRQRLLEWKSPCCFSLCT